VDASRLATKGLGATKPKSPNATPEGRQNNRRVELVKM
jgi:outer membrane protein OmpA-like peptidoglycan-associated protein